MVAVERPRIPEHGDYASNLAMQLAKKVGTNPRELARITAEGTDKGRRYRLGVARSGFINMRLKPPQAKVVTSPSTPATATVTRCCWPGKNQPGIRLASPPDRSPRRYPLGRGR